MPVCLKSDSAHCIIQEQLVYLNKHAAGYYVLSVVGHTVDIWKKKKMKQLGCLESSVVRFTMFTEHWGPDCLGQSGHFLWVCDYLYAATLSLISLSSEIWCLVFLYASQITCNYVCILHMLKSSYSTQKLQRICQTQISHCAGEGPHYIQFSVWEGNRVLAQHVHLINIHWQLSFWVNINRQSKINF